MKKKQGEFGIVLGEVVDTDDPQQMGRLRVRCPTLGDKHLTVDQLPWASYCSPFGGIAHMNKGPETDPSFTGYGMWNIPKRGATAAVFCAEGNPLMRYWIGCVYRFETPGTMPHGSMDEFPDGPVPGIRDGRDTVVNPLYKNLTQAFTDKGDKNHEYLTRGIDRNVSQVLEEIRATWPDNIITKGDTDLAEYGYKTGYQKNRHSVPSTEVPQGKTNESTLDSQIYSWVSPGFHAISMDDSEDNCRMRIRSAAGSQIIIDDTNERIYTSVAGGGAWIEMDKNGNIDVYSGRRISMTADKGFNFSTDDTFRVTAKKGIHLQSGDIRLNADGDIHVKAGAALRLFAAAEGFYESGGKLNVKAGAVLNLTSGADTNIKAGGNIKESASLIHLNGPPAASASPASAEAAFWTNRVPEHESWARTLMANADSNTNHSPELSYTSGDVGRVENGETIVRNKNWRR